jgi:DNA-binding transcriptional MerR regulator
LGNIDAPCGPPTAYARHGALSWQGGEVSERGDVRRLPPDLVWPVGQVAAFLGVPAVTIRSWERRYGIGPSLRSPGRHRRYSCDDVRRLRRMLTLIDQGSSPADAARLSARPRRASDRPVDDLLAAAEAYDLRAVAATLDDWLDRAGTASAWRELIQPAFQRLGRRFATTGDCTDIEVSLAGAVDDAVERYLTRRRLQYDGQPILLVPCPEERHTLPLTMLRAALLERSRSVVALRAGGNDVALLGAADRIQPSVVVLWSLIRRAGQTGLRRGLERRGHSTASAGPGWPPAARILSSLDQAVDHLTERVAGQ